ncbi:MAG: cation-translocating P-type ATPase [Burkholderiaceae bacterium]|nr:cation-translocating P-type ATPase [Burkholderiaceae bacterium]
MHKFIEQGLSQTEARRRLEADGPNELPSAKPRSLFAIAWAVLSEPMFLLLSACGGIYLFLGNLQDALILLGSVVVVLGLSFSQERKSERALEALRDLSSPRALVIRDGAQQRIAGREVVRGDIIMLSEGDRVPADALLLDGHSISLDESLLTGESVPVQKMVDQDAVAAAARTAEETAESDKQQSAHASLYSAFLYSGTMVVQGKCIARVTATAERTTLGKIGKALATQEAEPSNVQTETAHAVKVVALASSALVILLVIWYGATRGDWLNGILAGLTLAMSIMPVEFPLILAIFLGLGAWRIAQSRVLTRRIPAIEMLGAAPVLCVDKSGTLSEHRMALAQITVGEKAHSFADASGPGTLDEVFHETLEFAMLSSQRDPFDPMEQAIQKTGRTALAGTEHIHDGWTLVEEYPLSRELLAMSRVWQSPNREHYVIAAKGAPEAIADLCHLDAAATERLAAQVDQLAARGLRVLAVAKASFRHADLPQIQHDFEFELLGLIGLADPLRANVRAAIDECSAAGIRVIMVTGDYPSTAENIARQAGLRFEGGLLTGAELDALDDATLRERIGRVNIFCRVTPQQKLRLVNALKAAGEIVAMTGDGVNDAPALKAAHIGIAMGGRGTDVARESASLVLLDDEFNSIVRAVRLGRRIFDNLRKAVVFVIGAHIPIAGMSLLPVMLGWPLVLLPVHIVFFELMVDPTCSVVFEGEAEEADVMNRSPRPTDAKIFDRTILLLGLKQGLALLVLMLGIDWLARHAGFDADQSRALTFTAMIVGDIWLIFMNRSWTLPMRASLLQPNRALWGVLAVTVCVLLLALFAPPMSALFHFGTVGWLPVALTLALTGASLALLASLPWFRYRQG